MRWFQKQCKRGVGSNGNERQDTGADDAKSDRYLSGEQIAAECGISRAAVWKHIDQLKKLGCAIDAKPNCGYRLVSLPDSLDPTIVKTFDFSGLLKSDVVLKHFESVDSTNDVAKRFAAKGDKDKTVYIAEEQTAGRRKTGSELDKQKGCQSDVYHLVTADL